MFNQNQNSEDRQIEKLLRDAGPIYTGTYGRRLWVTNMRRLKRVKRVVHPTTFVVSLAIALICIIQISKLALVNGDITVQPVIAESSGSITNQHSLSVLKNDCIDEEAGSYSFLTTLQKDEPQKKDNQDLLPEKLRYKEVDQVRLKEYLNGRRSILTRESYFPIIINVAREYDINPLLLFAIAGQEQGYVSVDNPHSEQIANNPFNVCHSWKKYNTSIEDSSRIAAQTILILSLNRPDNIDPILWINRKYASDPNWGKGVNSLLGEIEKFTGKYSASNKNGMA